MDAITILEFDAWAGSGDMTFHVISGNDLKKANPNINLDDEDEVWDTLHDMLDDNGTIWIAVNLLSGVSADALEEMIEYRKALLSSI